MIWNLLSEYREFFKIILSEKENPRMKSQFLFGFTLGLFHYVIAFVIG
jgi:hypothetical protein